MAFDLWKNTRIKRPTNRTAAGGMTGAKEPSAGHPHARFRWCLSCLPDPAASRLPVPVLIDLSLPVLILQETACRFLFCNARSPWFNSQPAPCGLILQETGIKPASLVDVSV